MILGNTRNTGQRAAQQSARAALGKHDFEAAVLEKISDATGEISSCHSSSIRRSRPVCSIVRVGDRFPDQRNLWNAWLLTSTVTLQHCNSGDRGLLGGSIGAGQLSKMSRTRFLEETTRRSPVHFNQLVVWCLLVTGAILAFLPTFVVREGYRQGHVTLLFWLPDAVLDSPVLFWAFRAALLIGIVLWLLGHAIPWSCWLTVFGFTGLWSMHV